MAFIGLLPFHRLGSRLTFKPVQSLRPTAYRARSLQPSRMMADLPKDPKEMTESDWKNALQPREYHVLRQKGTEPAGSGEYDKFYRTFKARNKLCFKQVLGLVHAAHH